MGIIVVGVDASATAHDAAETAANLAVSLDSRLHLVTAYDRGGSVRVDAGEHAHTMTSLDRAEAVVAEVAADLRQRVPEVTTAAGRGKPDDVICEEATRVGADLIVVGNKRTQGAARVLGAIATKVVSHAPCDVYIAHTT